MLKLVLFILFFFHCLTGQTTPDETQEQLPDASNDEFLANMIKGLEEIKSNLTTIKPRNNLRQITISNLKFSTLDEIARISKLAGSAYCSSNNLNIWTCRHCNQLGSGIQVIHIFDDTFTGGRGFLALDKTRKQIIVSFRGSSNIQNWVGNALFIQSEYAVENGNGDIKVHLGFKESINALYPKFENQLKSLLNENTDFKLIITGHSLGGALATLASIEIKQKMSLSWDRIELYTYGEPRVGNVAFANWFNLQTLVTSRVVNDRDIVPHVPPRFTGYSQHHNEIFIKNKIPIICKTDNLEDPNCSLGNEPFLLISHHLFYYDSMLGGFC